MIPIRMPAVSLRRSPPVRRTLEPVQLRRAGAAVLAVPRPGSCPRRRQRGNALMSDTDRLTADAAYARLGRIKLGETVRTVPGAHEASVTLVRDTRPHTV